MITKLKFAKGNAKLGKTTAIFSLPAGHTCPAALACLSKSDKVTGKLTDGKACQFRCYAATGENLFKNIRISRWRNFEALKACKGVVEMADLIERSLPVKNTKLVRIHASGDFYSQDYFDAWLLVARRKPSVVFYAYTKTLMFWIRRIDSIPSNMKLVASRGGKFDDLIGAYGLRNVTVVGTNPAESPECEAKRLKLPIDHDDTHAWKSEGNFALSLHGTQPAGTPAAKAWHEIKTNGAGGYQADYFAHMKK